MGGSNLGLQTARGSGTTGHIQKNVSRNSKGKSSVVGHYEKRRAVKSGRAREEHIVEKSKERREERAKINEHNRRRDIEVRCVELKESLEETDENEETIDKKVQEFRKDLVDGPMAVESNSYYHPDSRNLSCNISSRPQTLEYLKNYKNGELHKNENQSLHQYKRRYIDSKRERLRLKKGRFE